MKVNELPYWEIEMILDGLSELSRNKDLMEYRHYEVTSVIDLMQKFRDYCRTLPNPEQEKTGERM